MSIFRPIWISILLLLCQPFASEAFSKSYRQKEKSLLLSERTESLRRLDINPLLPRTLLPIPSTQRTPQKQPPISSLLLASQLNPHDNPLVAGGDEEEQKLDRLRGVLVLMTVPFAWGTYGPVVKSLYAIQPAVPGFVFSACYYAVASVTTLSIVAFQDQRNTQKLKNNGTNTSGFYNNDGSYSESSVHSAIGKEKPSFPFLGGIELGTYLFVANCLQVVGLKTVPSDRAGFLVQLTTVMVPVAEAILAGNFFAISARTWFSCLLAFAGICVMNLDGIMQQTGSMASMLNTFKTFTQGDVLILLAAVLYTMHVVRLGRYAKETTPMKLAASKATVETVFSTGLVLALMSFAGSAVAAGVASGSGLVSFARASGAEISMFFTTITKGLAAGTVPTSAIVSAVGATLWTGLVTCAYTIFAQSYGQKRVGPTDANLIYSIQPICTAIFAFFLMGETMGPAGVVGGLFIGAAVYLVTYTGETTTKSGDNGDSHMKSSPQNMGEATEILQESNEELAINVTTSRR